MCLNGVFGRTNTRIIQHPGTYCKCEDGSDCNVGSENKKEECDCNVPDCGRDMCFWAEWGPWGDCETPNCHERGRMYKKR